MKVDYAMNYKVKNIFKAGLNFFLLTEKYTFRSRSYVSVWQKVKCEPLGFLELSRRTLYKSWLRLWKFCLVQTIATSMRSREKIKGPFEHPNEELPGRIEILVSCCRNHSGVKMRKNEISPITAASIYR